VCQEQILRASSAFPHRERERASERKRKVEALGNRPLSVMPVSLFSTKERDFSMENFVRSLTHRVLCRVASQRGVISMEFL
jgi:hypothetical protein